MHPGSEKTTWPAGPRGSLLTGHMGEFSDDPLCFLERCARDYGDFVPIRLLNKKAVILNDPDLIEEVLAGGHKHFRKTRGYHTPFTGRLFGNGLLTSEGETWMRQRRLAQPAFHRNRIAAYATFAVNFAEEMAGSWKTGETREVHSELTQLTTRIVCKAFFDADVPPEIEELERASLEIMEILAAQRGFWRRMLGFIRTPGGDRFDKIMDRLDAFLYRSIAERRDAKEDRGDILSMLLQTRDDQGAGMTDQQLRDELATLLAAGLDTTVLALSWTCYLLAKHPLVSARLESELAEVLDGRAPTLADLQKLRFTEAVLKEGMRLYPPAWIMAREAATNCPLGGYALPEGTSLLISQWLKHRDERYFEQPLSFRPERWLDGKSIPKFAYFPFGGGARLCIGSGFAMMEAPLVLAAICRKHRFECDPDYQVEPWASFTLQPKGGVRLRLAKAGTPAQRTRSLQG